MELPGAISGNNLKKNYSKKISKLIKKFSEFPKHFKDKSIKMFWKLETFFVGLEIILLCFFLIFRLSHDPRNSQINSKDIFIC